MIRAKRRLFRPLRWGLEFCGAWILWGVMKVLPLDSASALGGRLMKMIGPLMSVHRVAKQNLQNAFPEYAEGEIQAILRGMWDNLGRTLGELPHVDRIVDPTSGRVEVIGRDHIHAARDDGKCGLLFAAHLGNWELTPLVVAREGLSTHLFFRAPNNPLVQGFYERIRRGAQGELLPKGRQGARRALELLEQGEHLGLLVDQKMNDGIAVPFFGRDAMTAPALARFSRRFRCPVIPVRIVRRKGAYFRCEIFPPLPDSGMGGDGVGVPEAMRKVNAIYETWIREYPEQWLWVHRRWPK